MKRFLCLLLVALMIVPGAFSENIDLSGMTFEELVELKDKINLAIWQCQEWQEVTVPQGVWKVGEDIPAGSWTVKCLPKQYGQLSYGQALDKSGNSIDFFKSDLYGTSGSIKSETCPIYKAGDRTEYSFTVNLGDYIVIEGSSLVFCPYIGKPDLGFK